MTQFASLSEARRINAQRKVKNTCVHFSTPDGVPYRSSGIPTCNKPITLTGEERHGFLCEEHAKESEQVEMRRRAHYKPNVREDSDKLLVEGIIASEKRAIASGTVTKMRFGCIEPEYLHFWSF